MALATGMHGKSLAWVRDRCEVEGAGRALLYAVAAFADKHQGECTASAATLSRASGNSPRHVQRLLPIYVKAGILDRLDPGAGQRPACYRLNPTLWSSYDTRSQQPEAVATTSEPSSYDIGDPVATTSRFRSYDMPSSLTCGNGRQEKYVEEKSFEDSVERAPEGRASTGRAVARRADPEDEHADWSHPVGKISTEQDRRMRAAEAYLESIGAVWYDGEPYGYTFPAGLDGEGLPPGYLIPSQPSDLTWIRWAEAHKAKNGPEQETGP